MKISCIARACLACAAVALLLSDAQAARYSTADPGGADAELRESQPTTARGTGSEIASRIASGSRNSTIWLKFGVADISAAELANDITVRTTYRNTNLSSGRIEDAGGGSNTGMDYYVLDPNMSGADWDETLVTPTAPPPGYAFDGDFDTKATGSPGSPTAGLTYLGTNLYDSADLVGGSPHLPVGGNFDLVANAGSPLHSAIAAAQATNHQTVTVAMAVVHETSNPNGNWLNFNYLFNPKEQDPLNNDGDSPFGGASNSLGEFAPALITVPEPASVCLVSLCGAALLFSSRRRS